MFKSNGTIIFDPTAGEAANKWWAIVKCEKSIIDYYKYWAVKNQKIKISAPLFGPHISIIRGEEPNDEYKHLWKFCHGEEVEFTYYPDFDNNGEYWWLNIDCPRLTEIRKVLGLPEMPNYNFHLTIGKLT
ncbi:hypothetical protein D3C87_77230 [compost metagenome]